MTPFNDPRYLAAFEKFRRIPDGIFDEYFAHLRPPDFADGRVLDVGAGPGIQTEMILSRLPRGWTALAIDPSEAMRVLALARFEALGGRAAFLGTRLGDLEARGEFDAAWMSEVAHLLGEASGWTGRVAAVLRPGGRVLIRTSTHDQLRARDWYRYFPKALAVDLARHPTKEAIFEGLAGAGFEEISAVTVDESRTISADWLLTMMGERAFSPLHHLSQQELDEGLRLLRADLDGRAEVLWHYEMTAYTATRPGAPTRT